MNPEVHTEARPPLTFLEFKGPLDLRAAVSPDCSFQLVREALAQATAGSEVLLYIYNVSAAHLIQLLKDAKGRGASVRIMYDATDTRGAELDKLKELDVPLKEAPSRDPRDVFSVCHQKFVVIDKKIVVLGSANWAGTSIPKRAPGGKFPKGNREWLIRCDNPQVAEWFHTLFNKDWDIPVLPAVSFGLEEPEPLPLVAAATTALPPETFSIFRSNTKSDRLLPVVSPDNYFPVTLKLIQGAKKRVLIEEQYISGGAKSPSITALMGALQAKAAAGLDVRVVASSAFDSSWVKTVKAMREAGLESRLRAINLDMFVHCHNKGVLVDNQVLVTSTNWSESSIQLAREAGMLISSKRMADYFAKVFDVDYRTGWTIEEVDAHPVTFAAPGEETIHPADLREL